MQGVIPLSWIFLALAALLCWSGSDLFSKIGSRPEDKNSHWKMSVAVGAVMGLHALYEIIVNGVQVTWGALLAYLPASLLYISSMVIGYVALRYIELSLSSPICNCSGALAAVFCFLFLSETPETPVWIGVALVAVGIVSLGIVQFREDDEARALRQEKSNIKYARSLVALLLPVLYCLIDAAGSVADMIILENLDESVGNVAYELTWLLMGFISFIYVVCVRRDKLTLRCDGPKFLGGICETAGQFAYIFAIGDADHAGASAAIISCYCALSVLWSRIFLREKLSWKHYLAIFVAFAGIVVLGIYGD